MPSLDLNSLQWPAMAATLLAGWLVTSRGKQRRSRAFIWFMVSNVLWIIWAWQVDAYALITLEVGLFFLNVYGAQHNDQEVA